MSTTTLFAAAAICLSIGTETAKAQTAKPDRVTAILPDSCLITGEVDGSSKEIIVSKAYEHPLSNQILVPVIDGKFQFTLPAANPEAYMVILAENYQESLRPYVVFAEENAYLKLYPGDRYPENSVSGSPLSEEYHRIKSVLNQRIQARLVEIDSLQKLVTAGHLAEEVITAKDSLLTIDIVNWQHAYISEHPNLVSYQLLKELVLMSEHDDYSQQIVKKHYPAFAARYPDHPYTDMIGSYLNGEYQREEGKQYVSFHAEDLSGNPVLADTLLAPKATLLNFWSSWCGPCISKTRTMVPVYEAFKDKGFTVINIARELKSTESLVALLEREQLPWSTNLVDLESQYGVWHKYGITNFAGAMVLLDGDKRILAFDPTPEEVTALLQKLD